ncbi:unnamed protein product [Zymoseptoria tritici ST99CH_3D7]|uniref:[histone H3]-trimethyl-L-lysine(9) demethylase n=1 Tax=Zymoseptoria tritici (strain ST99CH_3D7) TaxID=1276538 RepID=A0A1X7S577_ZYMT9|nr:unnamed protein product [Zymoseptoria tritici ST99CH_3D7]
MAATADRAANASEAVAKPSIEHPPKPTAALTPPTSEEMNEMKNESQEDSELSDLDLDEDDDMEEIKPDHYWDEENGGRIPVFKPTMQQFASFKKFVDRIDSYGMKSGIVKVIPPKEWRDNLPALDEYVKRIRIKNPITQEFNGTFGTYTQQNVEKQRSYNLPEWKALTEESQYQPPARRGERRKNQEKVVRGGGGLRGRAAAAAAAPADGGEPPAKRKPGRPRRNPLPTEEPASDDESKRKTNGKTPPTPSSPAPAKKPRGRPPKGGQNKSVSSRRLNNTSEAVDVVDEKAFKNFDYRMDGLDEYTPERCAELETHYWKSLGFNQPMYAADMPGSLFDETPNSWNVAKLENLLDVLGTKVPGVNTAYLYMGMWKATFAWHLEDVDLYSINYIHFGAPKQWYSISQEDARKFEKAMKSNWPVDAKNCDQFLRHKTYLISPDVLQKQYGVKVNKLVHYEGEFVITYPYGYHSGYNIGYNCAESVNFATESWLEYGRIARKCNCESDNVWVDVSEIERKLRGEPTPEYYEETDEEDDLEDEDGGNLPSPPASVKGQKAPSKKRKRETKQEAPKKKKKIRIRIRAPTREPCTMCPNDNPWEPLLPTDNGKKAHLSCALYTPETFITTENGKQKVCGAANIDKARLELKCNYCRSKRGACFQCSSKKCTRAFHASCAVAAGVLVDSGLVPTFDEDGTEYYEEGYDFRCRYHRPKMPKNPNLDAMESSKRINNFAKELKPNDTVQAQYVGAEVFGGLVIENRPSELTLVVDVLPDGERVEVEYKYVCVLDPDDSVRPKPSASALPMPENMHKMNFSLANRQDGVPTQDELFNNDPNYKWHDFYNLHTPPPGYQSSLLKAPQKLKVDFASPDQLYYYLPKISTEAKVFFTDKPGGTKAVPKANFMDRMTTKPAYNYPPAKQSLPPASSNASGPMRIQPAQNAVAMNAAAAARDSAKPFLAEGHRQSYGQAQPQAQQIQPHQLHQQYPQAMQYSYPHNDTLPAAYQGEYSSFRRQSQGAQTMQRPVFENAGFTPSNSQQRMAPNYGTAPHGGTMPGNGTSMPPNPYAPGVSSRPSSAAQNRHSPNATHADPTTSDDAHTDVAYIQNLQKYPYLMNSFCRRPKVYESPYPVGGGFAPKYQPLELHKQDEHGPISHRTPSNSISGDAARPSSQQWTPPSKMWTGPPPAADAAYRQQAQSQPASQRYVQVSHQTPQEFQRQIQGLPSTASREGAHARMLREQGYQAYSPSTGFPRNSFGQTYDTAKMWHSPQAPTPSPLSDPNTPGYAHSRGQTPNNMTHWNAMARPDMSYMVNQRAPQQHYQPQQYQQQPPPPQQQYQQQLPQRQQAPGAGYGPMLPQMGGHETWRYN